MTLLVYFLYDNIAPVDESHLLPRGQSARILPIQQQPGRVPHLLLPHLRILSTPTLTSAQSGETGVAYLGVLGLHEAVLLDSREEERDHALFLHCHVARGDRVNHLGRMKVGVWL